MIEKSNFQKLTHQPVHQDGPHLFVDVSLQGIKCLVLVALYTSCLEGVTASRHSKDQPYLCGHVVRSHPVLVLYPLEVGVDVVDVLSLA